MGRTWRIHVRDARGAPGETIELPPEEAHHVLRVLRLTAGTSVALFDGRGREWVGRLVSERPGAAGVLLERERLDAVEPPLAVRLFQALGRADHVEWVIQKATEIGVRSIALVASDRAAPGGRASRRARWERIAGEAAKQCGRRVVPEIEQLAELPDPRPEVRAWVLDPGAGSAPLAPLGTPPQEVWLAVGPEGGFDPAELSAWVARGWVAAGLGPRILRTETAGLVAAAIVLHAWGDLGPGAVDPARTRS